jgi:copper transport protein
MTRPGRFVLALALILLACAQALPASAHADLLRSIPEANASLARSPDRVELFFSEDVDPKLSKLNVLDLNGDVVDLRDARVDTEDGAHMTTMLQPLKDGVYTVVWNVFSADDGHQTSGSFPFAVGNAVLDPSAVVEGSGNYSSLPIPDAVLKGILYLVAASLVGGCLFVLLVWNRVRTRIRIHVEDLAQFEQFSRALRLSALVALVTAVVLSLLLQAGHAEGAIIGLPWQPTFITVLMDTRLGVLAIARIGLAFVMASLLLPRSNKWNRWAGLVFSLIFLLTFSLESHAAAEPRPVLPLLADWIHLVAVSVWVGGLFSFLGAMWIVRRLNPERRTSFTSIMIPHFTRLALTSVGVLTITGIYSAILRVGTFNALLTSPYGQALIIKVGMAIILVFLGAVQLLIMTPAVRRAVTRPGGSPVWVARFRKLLIAEVVLGAVLLFWVGVLTSLAPPRVSSTPNGFYQEADIDDLTIALNVDPNRIGINTYYVELTSNGQPVSNAKNVSLEFTPISGMIPASNAALANAGNGIYSLRGGYFGMPDDWDVKVVIERQGKNDASTDFMVDNSAPTGQSIPWRTLAVSLLLLTALCYALAYRVLDANRKRWVWFGLVPAAALILISVVFYIQDI